MSLALLFGALGCEDEEQTRPARSPDETWSQDRAPITSAHAKSTDDEEEGDGDEPARARTVAEKEAPKEEAPRKEEPCSPLPEGTEGYCMHDKEGHSLGNITVPTLETKRAEVSRALAPLARDAVTPAEKAAARRAIDVALTAVERESAEAAIRLGFEMYRADLDRAVR